MGARENQAAVGTGIDHKTASDKSTVRISGTLNVIQGKGGQVETVEMAAENIINGSKVVRTGQASTAGPTGQMHQTQTIKPGGLDSEYGSLNNSKQRANYDPNLEQPAVYFRDSGKPLNQMHSKTYQAPRDQPPIPRMSRQQ